MPTKTYKYTSYIVSILNKLIGSNFSVTGLENIPKDQPIMFVSNHFTRSETFFVPYLINKYTGRKVRSLASSSLFSGFLGRFLKSTGTISTKDPNRNKIIVSDLVNNKYDWLIYPEGGMVKNKNITKDKFYSSHTGGEASRVKTGSAVLALKSQLYRRDIIDAYKDSNREVSKFFKDNYDSPYHKDLQNHTTYVVPLTVSYYPIRPGENSIESFAKKRIDISDNISEELQIEGNLLSNSIINLHFNKPINISDYIKLKRGLIYNIPIIKNEDKSNLIIKYFKYRLTTDAMTSIYKNLKINIDHLFSASIRLISQKDQSISITQLKRIIFLSAYMIKKVKRFRIHDSLNEENLLKLFTDEGHSQFESILELAQNLGEVTILRDDQVKINKDNLFKEGDFHSARIDNTLQVIFNEFRLLDHATNIVKKVTKSSDDVLKSKICEILISQDQEIYKSDYQKYYEKELSRPFSNGKPFLGNPSFFSSKRNKKYSIALCHGYKSSPKEMEALAKFLNGHGFHTYCIRLSGHGTNPKNIKDISWQDWDQSFQRGYAILKNITDNVIVVGFSTGGLLSLLNASRKKSKIPAVIAINPAIKLQDVRSKLVSTINVWNNLLKSVNIKKGSLEYVDSNPENPQTNYRRNYLRGVLELKKLMSKCEDSLEKVQSPALLIQASHDPVVNPEGVDIVYRKIKSEEKFLVKPDFNNHVIINGERKEEVFATIIDFLKRSKLDK